MLKGKQTFILQTPEQRPHHCSHLFQSSWRGYTPFVIKEEQIPGHLSDSEGVPTAVYEKSQAGNMSSEICRSWFAQYFVKYAVQERPLLLVLDDHQSHVDAELFQMG